MPEIVNPELERYVTNLVPARESALARVETSAYERQVPIIGELEGHTLALVARIAGTKTVLEVGTATGYSAIWLARAARERGGSFVGIELDPARHAEAVENLRRAGLADSARVIHGNALDVVAELTEQFDFVFLDLVRAIEDPSALQRLYELCVARLRVGGVLAVDNVLHGGDVVAPKTGSARAADALNRRLASDPRFVATFLTMRDGVAIALKVSE